MRRFYRAGIVGLAGAAWLLAAGCASRAVHASAEAAAPSDNRYVIGERFSLHSQILKEERTYWVYLPRSYGEKFYALRKYPVMYLLDGYAHFHSASGVVGFMSEGMNGNIEIPEMIIVAIPNTQRTRDLTPTHTTRDEQEKEVPSLASSGGGEVFLDFFQKELIPQIERDYRTMPFRMLVGHSFGGLLATDALLRRPAIFQAYIAIDPTLQWDQQVVRRRAEAMLAKTNDFRGQVFISVANNAPSGSFDPRIGKQACLDFADLLKKSNSALFRSGVQYFENENHGSVPLPSLYYGLLFIFEGYKPPGAMLFEDPRALGPHFAKVSERLGAQFMPSEEIIDAFGNDALYGEHDAGKALEYFKLNAANYPESFNAQERLARANDMAGNTEPARVGYAQALKLAHARWGNAPEWWDGTVHALLRLQKLQGKEKAVEPLSADWLTSPAADDPKGRDLVRLRADVYARGGQWEQAAAEFSKMIRWEPTNHVYYHALAPLLVASGDDRAYRRHCAEELRRFGQTSNPSVAERMAKDGLFVLPPGVDPGAAEKWADTALREGSRSADLPYFQFAKGLAEYRRGDFTNAAEWTQKVINAGGVTFRNAEAWLVLGMAQWKLQQAELARTSVAKGVGIIENGFPKLEEGDLGGAWVDWIMAQQLRKEAEELVTPVRSSLWPSAASGAPAG
jgi:predicted alpha/beta superfamily hydrolase